jgi:hypothetical protein
MLRSRYLNKNGMFVNIFNCSILWCGKGKARGMLLKSLINAGVEYLKGIDLKDQKVTADIDLNLLFVPPLS